MTDTLARILAFLVGASVGSFLNVCISRWPLGLSVVKPRSRCPRCGHQIAWYENFPLVSWLALRGKCRGCGAPISVVYPLVELTVGLGWLAAVMHFDVTLTALRVAVFGTVLLGIALTDAEHYLIPDGFTLFGLVWGLATAAAGAAIGETLPFSGLIDAVFGACVGAGAIAIAGWLGELAFKKEAMGFGDVTLMAMAGTALGPGRTLLTVFLGAIIGAVAFLGLVYPLEWLRSRRRNVPFDPPLVPFGVFLAPGALIALLWGYQMVEWYLGRIGG